MHLTKLASGQLPPWSILRKYNQDPDDVFRKVQLDPALMHQPGARYPRMKQVALWQETCRRIQDPCFGLKFGEFWHPSHFGTLGFAVLASSTLRITLERFIRFHRVVSDTPYAELHEHKDKGLLVFTLNDNNKEPYPPARDDAALAFIMSLLRVNFQQDLAPISVTFTHSSPDCADKFEEFFQAPITFDASVSSLSLSLDMMDIVLPSGNEELAAFSDQAMTKYIATLGKETLVSRVQTIIVEHLPSGNANIENVASELYLNTRKLQRLLLQDGTTFISLLNETRMKIAKQYVQDKTMDLTEVAFLLGFSGLSAFSRSFKRWTGRSPDQYRKAV